MSEKRENWEKISMRKCPLLLSPTKLSDTDPHERPEETSLKSCLLKDLRE